MKTSDLQGAALDWAVAHCQNLKLGTEQYVVGVASEDGTYYKPSTDWAQGGPIIEREGISIALWGNDKWVANYCEAEQYGPTALIAAMRCYVASKLGDDVEIPEDML